MFQAFIACGKDGAELGEIERSVPLAVNDVRLCPITVR
jgi:hypothetical protein